MACAYSRSNRRRVLFGVLDVALLDLLCDQLVEVCGRGGGRAEVLYLRLAVGPDAPKPNRDGSAFTAYPDRWAVIDQRAMRSTSGPSGMRSSDSNRSSWVSRERQRCHHSWK